MNKRTVGKICVWLFQDKLWPYASWMNNSLCVSDKNPVKTLCDCIGGVCSLIVIIF